MIYKRAMELIAALRSGKYRQAQGALRQGDGFCCLGVACDISGLGEWYKDEEGQLEYRVDVCNDRMILPPPVRDHFGFKQRTGKLPIPVAAPHGTASELSALNDNGMSFNQIADLIEKHWEAL